MVSKYARKLHTLTGTESDDRRVQNARVFVTRDDRRFYDVSTVVFTAPSLTSLADLLGGVAYTRDDVDRLTRQNVSVSVLHPVDYARRAVLG
jgi:hypothetical protein